MKFLNLTIGSFFRTLGRILAYFAVGVVVAYFAGFLNISNVSALENYGPFAGLELSDNGMFYNNIDANGANVSLGYDIMTGTNTGAINPGKYEWKVAYPSTETTMLTYGETLTQCSMSLAKDRYYSIFYYFYASSATYIYPPYSKTTYKMGIHSNVSNAVLNFNASEWYSDYISKYAVPNDNFRMVHSFNLVFKAPNNGNCLSVSINTANSQNNLNYGFVGYELIDWGEKAPTTEEIKASLDSSFNSINENITNMTESITNEQQQTNNKLDDLNSNISNSDSSGATGEAGNFFSGFTTDTFGLTSIITAPLNLIGSITSSTCSSVGLPLPYIDTTLNLPCLTAIYEEHFGEFLTIYQTITFGIVAYWVCVRVFALVKDFKNPDHDEVEVLEL